jgi:ABC-type nitrate/sulfonate/bicarbonate transport system permease component
MAAERVAVRDRAAFLRRAEHRLLRVAALAGLLVLWEALTRIGWIPALFLPSPVGVVRELVEMAASGQLMVHVAASLRRLVLGFAVGALAGVIVGIATGFFSRAEAVGQPLIAATALPMIFAGLKLGAGTALLLLVAAEMIAADSGIGFLVLHAGNIMDTTKLMVGIVCLSLLGVLSHWVLTRCERLAVPWRHTRWR